MSRFLASLTLALVFSSVAGAASVPGVVIDHQPAATQQYIGSPSIVKLGNGDYLATHDLFGPKSGSRTSAETKVFVSHDRGATWKQISSFRDQFWSNLFVLKNRVYLMGTTAEYGRIVIRTSDDNGQNWSDAHYLTEDSGYLTAPVPMAIQNGVLYRAFEYHPPAPRVREALLMWASVNSDLTKASSWSFSNRVPVDKDAQGAISVEEGNAVVAPDGSIVDILRVDQRERVAILRLSGKELKFDRFIDFPGGSKKFTIRFDAKTKLYWSLVNPALRGESLSVSLPGHVRNTLAVISSPDLIHWTPRAILIQHPDPLHYGFQYVDWQFDGDDLIAAVRTAYDDGEGGAHSYHDANYLTFSRVSNFRELGTVALAPLPIAETISPYQIDMWTLATQAEAAKRSDGAAGQSIGRYGTHGIGLTTRVKTGDAEQHRDWCDIYVVIAGDATLVSGGKLIDARTVADGEMRGSGIAGGHAEHITTGSIVHIDAQVPHLLVLEPGQSFTYLAIKAPAPTHSSGQPGGAAK